MFFNRIFSVIIVISLQNMEHLCDEDLKRKYEEAKRIAMDTKDQFYKLYEICYTTTMPNKKFISSNINSYINYPSKTTVGYSAKFTSNRKFFANMIATVAFRTMLEKDIQELKKDLIRKMEFCDEAAVLDQNQLKDFYDRDVDLSNL